MPRSFQPSSVSLSIYLIHFTNQFIYLLTQYVLRAFGCPKQSGYQGQNLLSSRILKSPFTASKFSSFHVLIIISWYFYRRGNNIWSSDTTRKHKRPVQYKNFREDNLIFFFLARCITVFIVNGQGLHVTYKTWNEGLSILVLIKVLILHVREILGPSFLWSFKSQHRSHHCVFWGQKETLQEDSFYPHRKEARLMAVKIKRVLWDYLK